MYAKINCKRRQEVSLWFGSPYLMALCGLLIGVIVSLKAIVKNSKRKIAFHLK